MFVEYAWNHYKFNLRKTFKKMRIMDKVLKEKRLMAKIFKKMMNHLSKQVKSLIREFTCD